VNGAAGGGTLVSFPALLAVGLSPLRANITSSVGILPGYLGGVAGFRREVVAEQDRAKPLALSAVGGALAGSILLLTTPAHAFSVVTPYLVLLAALLFAVQPLVAGRVRRRQAASGTAGGAVAAPDSDGAPGKDRSLISAHVGTFLGSVYGGYFGAGLGVILLAVLGTVLPGEMNRTSALRSILSLVVSSTSALVFLVHGSVAWADAGLLAVSSIVGGYLGARIARRLPPMVFRVLVVGLGLATAARLLAS
jgi:hypothetical protein